MATGTGKTWVLQALLIWQMLNKTAALDEGRDDPRFTRHFLIVAPGLIVYERLLDAFLGKDDGEGERRLRDFRSSRFAATCSSRRRIANRSNSSCAATSVPKQEIGLKATGNGMIAITNWHLLVEAEEDEEQFEFEDESLVTPGVIADAARLPTTCCR